MKFLVQVVIVFAFAAAAALFCCISDATADVRGRRGRAAWYGEEYRGRTMANGQPFDPDALTCATWDYPLGTELIVQRGDRNVIVWVTDRGPGQAQLKKGVIIDLSARAFSMIADPRQGTVNVTIKRAGEAPAGASYEPLPAH